MLVCLSLRELEFFSGQSVNIIGAMLEVKIIEQGSSNNFLFCI